MCACLDLLVSSSSWCLGRAAVCDCGTPWTFLLPFFFINVSDTAKRMKTVTVQSLNILKKEPTFSPRHESLTSLQKHTYSNILKCLLPKNENFSDKNSDIFFFHISAQNIDYGYSLESPRRGGSNEYPQSMFLSRNKKTNVYPCKPQFYYIEVGFKGVNFT